MPLKPMSKKQPSILVIGDIMLDRYIWGDVRRISPEAPVPVIHIKEQSESPGGAGNVALNLIGLECKAVLISIKGMDDAGNLLKDMLDKQGIHHILLTDKSRPTVTKTRVMSHKQQLFRMDEEKTTVLNEKLQKQLMKSIDKKLPGSSAVILSDYAKGIFQTPGVCRDIINRCRKNNIPVFVDPKGTDWKRYSGATCVTPNVSELELASGLQLDDEHSILNTAGTTRKHMNMEWLLVTRGADGMCLVGPQKKITRIKANAREVYDVTGAGDTVIAALAAGVAGGMSMPEAANFANTAAGIAVSKLGAQPVTRPEIHNELFINQFRQDPSFIKTHTCDAARLQAQAWRSSGLKIVFTNGCFDLLHPGHINLLNNARALGDRLIIGLNTDASIRRLKGKGRPILSEKDRAAILNALTCVDMVILFDEDTPLELIKTIKPDILVKGADYSPKDVVGRREVEAYGGKLQLVPLLNGYSTTKIADKVVSAKKNAIS